MKTIISLGALLTILHCASPATLQRKNINKTTTILTGKWIRHEGSGLERVSWLRYKVLTGTGCSGHFQTDRKWRPFQLNLEQGNFAVELPQLEPGENARYLGLKCTHLGTQKDEIIAGIDLTKIKWQPGIFVFPARQINFNDWDVLSPNSSSVIGDGQHAQILQELVAEYPEVAGFSVQNIKDDGFKTTPAERIN